MSKKDYRPPKPTTHDSARNLARVFLSPIQGADELLSYIWKQPFEKRLEAWRNDVADVIEQLMSKHGFDLTSIHLNEEFISVFIQSSAIAVRSHQAEKREALKNAILNTAISSQSNVDFYFVFVRYVDELTPIHMKLLSLLIQEESVLNTVKSYSDLFKIYNNKYPGVLTQDKFRMILGDLEIRGLIRISQDIEDFDDIFTSDSLELSSTNDNLPRILVTTVAKDFISFIAAKP